ncbi:hypothetical protein [Paenibacillus radicis (ex Gao et al. 2016)]|uniref:Uncharacterized protein n=1 Tax=Paenibacillus radicis (ex Gao et al. 2016) TaxID=1737354 RepID=A0A917M132_9BACL|nr:hypothetical protein [Paenibacillus radicis (ex Gao et al. 2016)]GGG68495.1 hypothetical protein GCM10010918_24290 [Paenibacillus radicis (ex Gao et al. 2016)]
MREGQGHRGNRGHRDHGEHRDHGRHHHKSAQTFRRGRAIAFLDTLVVKRTTLQRQLNDPQFESIKPVISGELKATETIMEEFIHLFQLQEASSEESDENEGENGKGVLANDDN